MLSRVQSIFVGVLSVLPLIGLSGCNEFVTNVEPVTSIDVVGDPNDPVADSMEPADILGSALPVSDDSEGLTDVSPGNSDLSPTKLNSGRPASRAGKADARPVSLKKNADQGADPPQ